MRWSSVDTIKASALLTAAMCSLGGCATRPPGDISLASINLNDDGVAAEPVVAPTAHRPGVGSPIAQICAYPGGRKVLDSDLPGLTERPEYVFFQHMSLKTLQGMSRGQLKDDDIRKVDADLRALP